MAGFYDDYKETRELLTRFSGDMRAFKQKVVQVIYNATLDPETITYPMEELNVDDFLQELYGEDEDEDDDDPYYPPIQWNITAPSLKRW